MAHTPTAGAPNSPSKTYFILAVTQTDTPLSMTPHQRTRPSIKISVLLWVLLNVLPPVISLLGLHHIASHHVAYRSRCACNSVPRTNLVPIRLYPIIKLRPFLHQLLYILSWKFFYFNFVYSMWGQLPTTSLTNINFLSVKLGQALVRTFQNFSPLSWLKVSTAQHRDGPHYDL